MVERDLVFLLDGSGSIDAADWRLQLDSYAAALQDTSHFPADGSVAIGVIQWAGNDFVNGTRVEVPLTVLDSASSANKVIDKIMAIKQMGAATNSGDAVQAGTTMLLATGRLDARWSLCMSTDGPPNSGSSLSAAVNFAKTSAVDRFSVIAIQDPGFDRAAAENAYGPYVFGGGSVTFARTTGEFGGLISGCIADPLQLEALEVTQGVQDLDNTVPLVHDKGTMVRAYISPVGEKTRITSARLHGRANGVELVASPITWINPSQTLRAEPDPFSRRGETQSTANFVLPRAWTQVDDLELELEVPGGVVCTWGTSNRECAVSVSFIEGLDLNVHYVGLNWADDDPEFEPITWSNMAEQAQRARQQLPASNFTPTYATESFAKPLTSLGEAHRALDTYLVFEGQERGVGFEDNERWIGLLPGKGPGGAAGQAYYELAAAWMGANDSDSYGRNRLVHELGHTLGLHHSVSDLAAPSNWPLSDKHGWCNETASFLAPDFPFTRLMMDKDAGGLKAVAAIGPDNGPRSDIWGADLRFFNAPHGSDESKLALAGPDATTSLMSYCGQGTSEQKRWISSFDYTHLLDGDIDPIGGWFDAGSHAGGDGLLVRATVSTDDAAATFAPSLAVRLGPALDNPAGTHRLVVRDQDGAELSAVRFTPERAIADMAAGEADVPGDFPVSLVVPPLADSARTLELVSGERVLASSPISPTAPAVTVGVPSHATADAVTFEWAATDLDGDSLHTTLLYSTDDGATWNVIASALTSSSVTVSRESLPGSTQARIRTVVSDGMRSVSAVSPRFALPNLAPTVTIDSPTDGQLVSGSQTILFDALAHDPEDGSLDGQSVTWTSDRDGLLGSGASMQRRADELSEGVHHVTVTATDSGGAQTSATATIEVRRIVVPVEPEPTCTVAYNVWGPWDTGYTATVVVKNLTDSPMNGWTVTWERPSLETTYQAWDAVMTVTSEEVSASNASWNSVIPPGGEKSFGLLVQYPRGQQAVVPQQFSIGGAPCTTA